MKKKKIFAITGIIAVSFSLLGCHKSTSTSSNEGGNGLEKFIEKQKENDTNINTDTSKDIDTDTSDSGESSFGNIDANTNLKDRIRATSTLFNSISEKYQETQLEEEYEKPMYLLPQDYVFEFDCSESAGNVSYKAFEVYDNSDFEQKNGCSYCTCSYEDGKIYVEPWGAIYLDESGSKNSKDGTWGSLNTLYLVQRIDLQTGEDLSKPKVTPFSIQHDVDAPTVTQGVTDENTYTLSWKPVAGAVEYRVYQYFSSYYELQCYTSDTSVTVEDFARQKESEKFSDLVKNDLENAGYEVERGTYLYMNSGARFDDDNGYYLVVEVDSNGKQSGISNIVDVRKVASRLPYYVSEKIEKKIVNIEDTPTYVGVEMVDGSTEQMLINYHGAKVTKLEDGDFIVDAHICNTKFDSFRMKFSGMSYEQFLEETSAITERQDQLNKSGGCMNSDAPVPNAPSNNRDEKNEELDEIKKQLELILPDLTVPTISVAEDSTDSENDVPEEIQESDEPDDNWNLGNDNPEAEAPESEEPEDNWSPENDESTVDTPESEVPEDSKVSDNISTDVKGQLSEQDVVAYEIFCEILADVERKLEGIEGIDSILYATNDLEAWIAYCLIAQEPCIPVPTCVFPEAVNIDYVYTLYYEAYRQNPTSGMLSLKGYNYDYQLLGVKYCEELDTRLDKTREEIGKAKEVANSITTSSMSDADKVMAINEYLCENASYDYDSCNCDVDFDNLSEPFIDAHTPYGILCKNYGVCESYSEAFALIGRIAGLQVVMESGDLQGGPHEWNRVCVDGSWCVVDVTNNDSDFANPLLNVSEKQIEGVLIPDGYSYLDTYEALDETKEYYYLNGLSTNTDDEAVSLLCSILKNEDCARVRIKPGTSAEDIQNIVQEVCNKEQIDCKYYSFANVIMIEKV